MSTFRLDGLTAFQAEEVEHLLTVAEEAFARTEADRLRYAGVLTSDGISLGGLADKRLTNLRRYQREMDEQ